MTVELNVMSMASSLTNNSNTIRPSPCDGQERIMKAMMGITSDPVHLDTNISKPSNLDHMAGCHCEMRHPSAYVEHCLCGKVLLQARFDRRSQTLQQVRL